MHLTPNEEELSIQHAAKDYLAGVMPISRLHQEDSADLSVELRREIASLGWFSLAVPVEAGGAGLSVIEHALFFLEAGVQCGPIDLLTQCLAVIQSTGLDIHQGLCTGEEGVALCVEMDDQVRVFGTLDADYLLHSSTEKTELYKIKSSDLVSQPFLNPANSSYRLPRADLELVHTEHGDRIWRMGETAVTAMLVGLSEAALDLIVEYAKIRETFGRKIGSYQAVRHPLANALVRIEAAKSQLYYAVTSMKSGLSDAHVHLDAAKHLANETALQVTDLNIQLHGGIGVTEELDAHLMLKHALMLTRIFGSKRVLLQSLQTNSLALD